MEDDYIKSIKNTYFFIIAFSLFTITLLLNPSSQIDKARQQSDVLKTIDTQIRAMEFGRNEIFQRAMASAIKGKLNLGDSQFCSRAFKRVKLEGYENARIRTHVQGKRVITGAVLNSGIDLGLFFSKDSTSFMEAFPDYLSLENSSSRLRTYNSEIKITNKNNKSLESAIQTIEHSFTPIGVLLASISKGAKVDLELIPLDSKNYSIVPNGANKVDRVETRVEDIRESPECDFRPLLYIHNQLRSKKTGTNKAQFDYPIIERFKRSQINQPLLNYSVLKKKNSNEYYLVKSVAVHDVEIESTSSHEFLIDYACLVSGECLSSVDRAQNSFEEVKDFQKDIQAKSFDDLDRILNLKQFDLKKDISLFGFSVNANVVIFMAPAIIISAMLFLAIHLWNAKSFLLDHKRIPWIAVYGLESVIINIIAMILLPLLATASGLTLRTHNETQVSVFLSIVALLGVAIFYLLTNLNQLLQKNMAKKKSKVFDYGNS